MGIASKSGTGTAPRGPANAVRAVVAALALGACAQALNLRIFETAAAAPAADAVFTVGNYPVEARAENAVTAKTKALFDGQQAAFRSLLKRLVPVTAYQRLRQLRTLQVGDLVEGVSVRSERNSSTDYIASLDFAFQSNAVRDLLRREGIPFTDQQAPTLTLVPLWRTAASAAPREDAAWTNVWKGLDLEHALTPVKLQALKKEIAPTPSTRWPKATAAPSARWSRATAASWSCWSSPSRISRPSGSTSRSRGATPSAPSC